jgi:predicted nucleic acid-binding protein
MRRYLLDTNMAADLIEKRGDIMIAAIAKSLGNCTVVSADSDLTAVPGLSVESWRQ